MLKFLLIAIALLNIITFVVYGIDKLLSKRKGKGHKRRISESTLLIMAAAGGSIGALLAMRIWRHKTQHAKFKFGVPAILILHTALTIYALIKWY
jgi:uncharacterized membrane protein YsdA (DUF1294 family)